MPGPVSAREQMELHLVLAFDVSASVNDVEFDIQRTGTAQALRHPSIGAAIVEAEGGVAISIVQWSSISLQAMGLDWQILQSGEDVAAFAGRVQAMERKLSGGGTMIHTGLEFAARQLDVAPGTARRQVIDLSGNGRSDDHDKILETRDHLLSEAVVINALAIEEHNDRLTTYYRDFLIGGPGAFVITADEFEDFEEAMRRKLHREIMGPVFSRVQGGASARLARVTR